jgi:hypothetical protein
MVAASARRSSANSSSLVATPEEKVRVKSCLLVLCLLITGLFTSSSHAQTPDPRDYEVGYFVPSKTTIVNFYLRHQSGTKGRNYDADAAIFRATYIVKFGDLVITPFDLILPVVDQRGYVPLSTTLGSLMTPGAANVPEDLKLTVHASGLGDMIFLPTIGYGLTQDKTIHTHTWMALTTYITAPTGKYEKERILNVGSNRWTINPTLVVGQRFLKAITVEGMANMAFYTDNDEYRLPVAGLAGQDLTLKQKPSFGLTAHLAVDLHPMFFIGTSYYLMNNGRRDYVVSTPAGDMTRNEAPGNVAVHTFRLNLGIRVTPQTLVLGQWNQDVAGTESAALGRFFGIRISHAFFAPPKPPVAREPITDRAAKTAAEDAPAKEEPKDDEDDADADAEEE